MPRPAPRSDRPTRDGDANRSRSRSRSRRPRRRAGPAWPEALAAFETHLRASRAARLTVATYLRALAHLRQRLAPLAPAEVTTAALREVQVGLLTGQASRSGRPLAAATVLKEHAAWRAFFAFLAAEDLLAPDPAARLDPPRAPRPAPDPVLSEKEVERLLAAAPLDQPTGLRDRAVAELLYATGVRRAELCGLDLVSLDHAERELRVTGKGERGRVVPVTRSAHAWVQAYLERARPALASDHAASARALFLSRFGTRLDEQSLRRLLLGLRRRAGLRKPVTPHALRRAFATHLLRRGASLRHLQLLLGHRSLDTTALYLRLEGGELRREVLLKHPRERFA